MSRPCLLWIHSSNHLCSILESLFSLESPLNTPQSTWFPVIPWQMILVYLLTQTLGAVEKLTFPNNLGNIISNTIPTRAIIIMEDQKQKNFISKIIERAKVISKSERTFKIIKKLKQAVETLSKGEKVPIESLLSQEPTKTILVYHYGQGLEDDLVTLKTQRLCEESQVILKAGSPYGTILFPSQIQSKQFMDSCLVIQGSEVHYLQLKFPQNQRIVFYFYLAGERLQKKEDMEIEDCTSYEEKEPIPGLILHNNFMSPDEQSELVKKIDSCKWIHLNNRKVQHYGYEFKYGQNNINKHIKTKEIPEFFDGLMKRLTEMNLCDHGFDQLTINCYDPGDGIPFHFDTHSPFEEVFVSISLLSDIVMELRSYRKETRQILLRERSLAVFTDEARYAWVHGITGRKVDKVDGNIVYRKRRISLTFRKIKYDPCVCRFYFYCDSQGYDQYTMKKTNPLLLKYLAHQNIAHVDKDIETELVEKVYNQFGHTFNNPIHPKVIEFIDKMEPQSVVLDIGCGNGNYLEILRKKNHFAIGIEKCVVMKGVEEQQRIFSDALSLPFRNGSFDSVLMIAVFHHFSTEERRLASLQEIARVLKPHGHCMITVWSYEHLSQIYPHQDILLDFTLPKHRSKTLSPQQIYKRYYHLFRQQEIQLLVQKCKLRISSITSEYNNYYITLQNKLPL